MDNIALIVERRAEMQASGAGGTNAQRAVEKVSLLAPQPFQKQVSARLKVTWMQFAVGLALGIVPGLIIFFTLWNSKSTLLTLGIVTLYYAAVLAIHYFFFDKELWRATKLVDVSANMDRLFTNVFVSMTAAAIGIAVVFILYSEYISWGPRRIKLYFPDMGFLRFLFWIVYFAIQIAVLPIVETLYYYILIFSMFYHTVPLTIILAGMYGFMNFAWIVWTVDAVGWVLFLTLLALALGWFLLVATRRASITKAIAIRVGVGIGLSIYLLYLNLFIKHVKSPQSYEVGFKD